MLEKTDFGTINEAKANLDHIYDQPDPRAYFRELGKLGYAIPGHAQPVFRDVISHLRHTAEDTVQVLDLGCSYGVNAALLKHDLSMSELYEHWGSKDLLEATPEEVVARDRRFFGDLHDTSDIEVIGLDPAKSAIAYAEQAGLLDEGIAVNLESESLPEDVTGNLAPVDLVMSTGCVGYATERTFDRLLPAVAQEGLPWMGHFVLRLFPFDVIEAKLGDWGYVTEKLEGRTFVQRRFASTEEQDSVLEQLRACGVDPTGRETEGHLLAEFYLSRPKSDVATVPIEHLLSA